MNNWTEDQLQAAREYTAKVWYKIAEDAPTATYYADHVTNEDRKRIAKKNYDMAMEIESGMHDNNLTIAQKMHYFLTGDCVALLP